MSCSATGIWMSSRNGRLLTTPFFSFGSSSSHWGTCPRPALTLSLGLRHEFQTHLADKNNFAPRVSIAWSPFKDRKTTFRAGGGLFYSRLSANLNQSILRYDGDRQQSFIINNPRYPDPFEGNPQLTPQNTINCRCGKFKSTCRRLFTATPRSSIDC